MAMFEAYERFRGMGDWNTDSSKEKWTLGSSLEFNDAVAPHGWRQLP